MGFRFRKSFKIAKGLRINLGKRGASLSIGGRGATLNVGAKGVRGTVGLPGTGLSYSTKLTDPSSRSAGSVPGSGPGLTARPSAWSVFFMAGAVFWLVVGLAGQGSFPWLMVAASLFLSLVVGMAARGATGPNLPTAASDVLAEGVTDRAGPGTPAARPVDGPGADLVFLNRKTRKFHHPNCRFARSGDAHPVARDEAMLSGMPCMACH